MVGISGERGEKWWKLVAVKVNKMSVDCVLDVELGYRAKNDQRSNSDRIETLVALLAGNVVILFLEAGLIWEGDGLEALVWRSRTEINVKKSEWLVPCQFLWKISIESDSKFLLDSFAKE